MQYYYRKLQVQNWNGVVDESSTRMDRFKEVVRSTEAFETTADSNEPYQEVVL
jgi:hypothetical protein